MFDALYRRRLEKDLERWTGRGWVSAENAGHIRGSLGESTLAGRLPAMLAFLGAVLLAFAAMTFVAANWDEIARIVRFALLLAAMGLAYALAVGLERRGHPLYADAAVMLGAGIFGAAIMLVAQIYHIQSRFADGMLMWTLGALAAALLGASRGAVAIAFGGLVYWSGLEMLDGPWRVHWPFLPLWALAVWAVERRAWQAGRHLAVLALFIWLVLAVAKAFDVWQWPLFALSLVYLPVLVLSWVAAHLLLLRGMPDRLATYGPVLRPYAIFAVLFALFGLQELSGVERIGSPLQHAGLAASSLLLVALAGAGALVAHLRGALTRADVVAVALIAIFPLLLAFGLADALSAVAAFAPKMATALMILYAAIWTIGYGQTHRHRTSVALGLIAFGGEVVYLYFETFGTLLDTALFFLFGGVLLIALAFGLTRLHKRLADGLSAEHAP